MNTNRFTWPMILGIIGAVLSVVVGFTIAFFATGGRLVGVENPSFGDQWLLISIMAIAGPLIGLVGASIVYFFPRVGGTLMLLAVVEYFVVGILIGRMSAVPYLVFGGIGISFLFISGMMSLLYPMMNVEKTYLYNKDYYKDNWNPHQHKNRQTTE